MSSAAVSVRSREELIGLLHQAAELEHGLCCSYLYAAFSLRPHQRSFDQRQTELVGRWRATIIEVALQEMLHLALVSNVLTSVGAAPKFDRPRFPQRSAYYPAGLTISLSRFDDRTLSRFVHLERPGSVPAEPATEADPDIAGDDAPSVAPGALTPSHAHQEAAELPTQRGLYEAIEDGLVLLTNQLGASRLFIGPPEAQATGDSFPLQGITAVYDLASAQRALSTLVAQGEGNQVETEDSHYARFRRVRDEFRCETHHDPTFDPAGPVVPNPVGVSALSTEDGTPVEAGPTLDVMALCDSAYATMTSLLARYYACTDEDQESRNTLATVAIAIMREVVSPLGVLLTHLPASDNGTSTAGPAFELHHSATTLPDRRVTWTVLAERLVELSERAAELSNSIHQRHVLTSVSEALRQHASTLSNTLRSNAADLSAADEITVPRSASDPLRQVGQSSVGR